MNNQTLFARIKKLVSIERRIGVEILECLYEIERRSAYAELQYDGLFTYCVKELGFTDFQAFQRIQAMRALREIPELKSKIETGSLSVSSVSMVQTHLRKERKSGRRRSTPEKLALFRAIENCTSREVEAKLAEERGEKVRQKLVLELDEDLQALWTQVKNLAAHRSRGDESEVLRILATEWLGRHDPSRKAAVSEKDPIDEATGERGGVPKLDSLEAGVSLVPGLRRGVPLLGKVTPSHQRYISAATRRTVWKRDGAQCTQCRSKYALEIDHRQPFALGGGNATENLRLLCRSCNRFAAVQVFGVQKMQRAAQRRPTKKGNDR